MSAAIATFPCRPQPAAPLTSIESRAVERAWRIACIRFLNACFIGAPPARLKALAFVMESLDHERSK